MKKPTAEQILTVAKILKTAREYPEFKKIMDKAIEKSQQPKKGENP